MSETGSLVLRAASSVPSRTICPWLLRTCSFLMSRSRGQILFEIDPRPYQDQLRLAQAQLASYTASDRSSNTESAPQTAN